MKICEVNKSIEQIVSSNNSIYFCKRDTPFFKFNRQDFPDLEVQELSHEKPIILFLLGIKNRNHYHLNVVTFNTISNTIERFEPYGVEKTQDDAKINKFVLNSVSTLFKVKQRPSFLYNKTKVQTRDGECAICCLKYITMRFKKREEN